MVVFSLNGRSSTTLTIIPNQQQEQVALNIAARRVVGEANRGARRVTGVLRIRPVNLLSFGGGVIAE